MQTKTVAVISLVLLAGFVGSAEGLWCTGGAVCTPEEEIDLCDPNVWPGGKIPFGDESVYLPCNWRCMKICCDMDFRGRLNGPGGYCDQTLRIYCGIINVTDRWYVAHSGPGTGTLILEGTAVVNSLSGSSYSFRCGDAGGRPQVIVRDNAILNINGGWRNGDSGGGWACIAFGGNCTVNVNEYIRMGDNGAGEMHFDGGNIAVHDGGIGQDGRGGVNMGDMTVSGDVEVYCSADFGLLTRRVDANCYMSGGAVNVRSFYVHGGGSDGHGKLVMTGGLIIARESFNCPREGLGAKAETHLDGGTIECASLNLPEGGTMDITGGALVLQGNQLMLIHDLRNTGRLTGFGSPKNIKADFNITNAGKTTVVGVVRSPLAAWNPSPPDTQVWVGSQSNPVVCTWEGTHSVKDSHIVFFDTDLACVTNTPAGDMTSPCYKVRIPAGYPRIYNAGLLPLWTTYYWRVDESYYTPYHVVKGNVWSFTTGCEPIDGDINNDCVVNFEDYAAIAESWGKKEYWPDEDP